LTSSGFCCLVNDSLNVRTVVTMMKQCPEAVGAVKCLQCLDNARSLSLLESGEAQLLAQVPLRMRVLYNRGWNVISNEPSGNMDVSVILRIIDPSLP